MWVPLFRDGYGYLRSIDRNYRAVLIHRACWEAYYGPIRWEFDVHHIDGDKSNNEISNLASLSSAIHQRIHGRATHARAGGER